MEQQEELPRPRRICVEWGSSRVDVLPLEYMWDKDRFELREFVRELSDSSPQIRRVWIEDENGGLLYAAVMGRGHPLKGGAA